MEQAFLKTEQVATMLQVNTDTVVRWIRDGQLKGFLLPGGRTYRISQSELDKLTADHPNSEVRGRRVKGEPIEE